MIAIQPVGPGECRGCHEEHGKVYQLVHRFRRPNFKDVQEEPGDQYCTPCIRTLVQNAGYNDRRIIDLEDEVARLRDLNETLIEATRDAVNLARRLNDERAAVESREAADEPEPEAVAG
jgi:hypothetical protein